MAAFDVGLEMLLESKRNKTGKNKGSLSPLLSGILPKKHFTMYLKYMMGVSKCFVSLVLFDSDN